MIVCAALVAGSGLDVGGDSRLGGSKDPNYILPRRLLGWLSPPRSVRLPPPLKLGLTAVALAKAGQADRGGPAKAFHDAKVRTAAGPGVGRIAAWAAPLPVFAVQSARQDATLRSQSLDVSDNLYLISGGGGNSLMMAGDEGVVLVDTKRAGFGKALLEIASSISDQPLTTIVHTHGHADHTGSTPEFPSVRQVIGRDRVKDRLSLLDGRDRIELYSMGPAHTNSDLVVAFPGKRIALVGDLFPGTMAPVIDVVNGGSGVAFPETLTRVIAELKGITRIIPGHAVPPPGSPLRQWMRMADLQEYADFTRDLLAAVRDAFAKGKTADEAAAGLTLPDRYKAYALDNARAYVQAVYREIGR